MPVISRTRDGIVRQVSSDEENVPRRRSGDLQRQLGEFVRRYLDEYQADEERRKCARVGGCGDAGEEGGIRGGSGGDPEHPVARPRRPPIERLEGNEAVQALIRSSRPGTSSPSFGYTGSYTHQAGSRSSRSITRLPSCAFPRWLGGQETPSRVPSRSIRPTRGSMYSRYAHLPGIL